MFILNSNTLVLGGILLSIIIYNLFFKQKPYIAPYDQETEGERFEKKWNHFHSNNGCKWERMEGLTDDQKEFMNHFLDL